MKFVVDKVNDDDRKETGYTASVRTRRWSKQYAEEKEFLNSAEVIGSGSGLSKIASRPVQHDAIGFVEPSS